MQIEEILKRLQKVRQTRSGWMSICPAHDDRTASFSIARGERAILVHCFAGCTIQEIVQALGINVRDLFFDSGSRRSASQMIQERSRDRAVHLSFGVALDAMREAESLVLSARGIDITDFSSEQLEAALNVVAAAYLIMELDANAIDC